jgi:hypothetical protein
MQPEEREAVLAQVRPYRELRHWELSGRMMDEDEAYLSPSTAYRILKSVNLVVSFLNENSRNVVHSDFAPRSDGITVSTAVQTAIDTLPSRADAQPVAEPEIRSDNGSGYFSRNFKVVLPENGLGHRRIKPHCPEENELIKRINRTLRGELDGES